MKKKYVVKLSDHERKSLEALTSKGVAKVRRVKRARILLMADEGHTDTFIAFATGAGKATVERTRKRCVLEGIEAALSEKPRPGQKRKLTEKEEAKIVALACTTPPDGRKRWSLRLLADKAIELIDHESLSYETVRRTLKKTNLSPGSINSGVSAR